MDNSPSEPASTPGRSHWKWSGLIAILLLSAILYLLYSRWRETGFEWSVFLASFRRLNWIWLSIACVFALLTYYGRVLRWAVMLKPLRPHPSTRNLLSATAIGFSAIFLLGRPGELVRPYLISVKERVPFSSQLAAWFLERILDLLALLVIFGFALTRTHESKMPVGPILGWLLEIGGWASASLGLVCLVLLFMMGRYSEATRTRLMAASAAIPGRLRQRFEGIINAFADGTSSAKQRNSVVLLFAYTALEWALIALCYLAVFRAFDGLRGFSLTDILTFMGFVAFGSIVQIPGIGGGVQIVSVLILTDLFGLPLELATSVAILVWIITFATVVPLGLVLAFHEGLNWRKLKELKAQASI